VFENIACDVSHFMQVRDNIQIIFAGFINLEDISC